MTKVELTIVEWIRKKSLYIFLVGSFVLGMWLRWIGRWYMSEDWLVDLEQWYSQIKQGGGLKCLGRQVGDYNLLYQTLIAVMTYLPIRDILAYKLLSVAFDVMLSIVAGIIVYELSADRKKERMIITSAVIFLLPTVVWDSAYWAQSDSIYTSFLALTLLMLIKKKDLLAFIFYGISLAFKLQAIFLLPFLLYYYIAKKSFSIICFFISPLIFWFTGIVAFFYGRELSAPFTIFAEQTEEYTQMSLNCPSFWNLVSNDYMNLKVYAIGVTIVLLFIVGCLILSEKIRISMNKGSILLATWCMWTIPLFLPAMHERYFYFAEILMVILAVLEKRYIKYAFLIVVVDIMTYSNYLFDGFSIDRLICIVYLVMWFCFSFDAFKSLSGTKEIV